MWNLQLAKVPGVLYGDPLDRIIAEFASGVCQVGRPSLSRFSLQEESIDSTLFLSFSRELKRSM